MLQVGSSPLYRQLADVVRQRIAKGIWDVGTQIPSFDSLAAEFGVALITVRQAVALLAQEGLVHAQRGRGTHVIAGPRCTRASASRPRWPAWPRSTGPRRPS
jgi:GntR family transcriptional regulator